MYLKASYHSLSPFKKDLCSFESIDGFYRKLLTVLSLICRDGKGSCFCKKYKECERGSNFICPLCYIPMFFHNFQQDLELNQTDRVFWCVLEISCFIYCRMFHHERIFHSWKICRASFYDLECNIVNDISLIDLSILL